MIALILFLFDCWSKYHLANNRVQHEPRANKTPNSGKTPREKPDALGFVYATASGIDATTPATNPLKIITLIKKLALANRKDVVNTLRSKVIHSPIVMGTAANGGTHHKTCVTDEMPCTCIYNQKR